MNHFLTITLFSIIFLSGILIVIFSTIIKVIVWLLKPQKHSLKLNIRLGIWYFIMNLLYLGLYLLAVNNIPLSIKFYFIITCLLPAIIITIWYMKIYSKKYWRENGIYILLGGIISNLLSLSILIWIIIGGQL